MFHPWLFFLTAMLPFLGLAIAVLYAGYVAYDAEQIRKRREAAPKLPDPVHELARVNAAIEAELARSREAIEQARVAIQRGVRG